MQTTTRALHHAALMLGLGLLAWLTLACSHDLIVRYPDHLTAGPAGSLPTGKLVVLLNDASNITLTVNGVLLVHDEKTSKVEIANVPTGPTEVAIATGGGAEQHKLFIQSDYPTTLPVAVGGGAPNLLNTLVSTAVTVLLYTLARQF